MLAYTTFAMGATGLLSIMVNAAPIAAPQELATVFNNLECIDGVRLIAVRGSDTPWNLLSGPPALTQNVANAIPNSAWHNLQYPAVQGASYTWSETTGVNTLTQHITEHIDACPNQRFALIGYSQGAQVVGDTLIGPSGTQGQGLAEKYRNNIVGVVQFADPSFVPGQSFDKGTNTYGSGTGARNNVGQYYSYGYANKMQSYCDANDMFCASGSSLAVHESYFSGGYVAEAEGWLINQINSIPSV